jgi:hypothetical protein
MFRTENIKSILNYFYMIFLRPALGLGDISNICDVSRDVLQGMYKMHLSRTSNTNWHAMFIFFFHTRFAFTRRGDKISYKVNVETRIGRKNFIRATLSPCTGERVQEDVSNLLELKYFNFDANFAQ